MGIAKKTDGRYVVGVGVDNANDYRGSAAYRDIYIQLTSSGATEQSEEYLTFLKDYAVNANALGEPIMPPSVNVWISNNGVTTAVEADDVSIDGNNYTICGIKWNGSAWDYTNAGQGGGGGSSLPSYSSSDIGKVLTVGEGSETVQTVIVPEQTVTVSNGPATLTGADVSGFVVGNTGVMIVNGVDYDVAATVDHGATAFGNPDSFMIGLVNGNALFVATAPGTYTVSLTVSAPSAEPKWEALIPTYPKDGAFELEVEDTSTGGTVIFNSTGNTVSFNDNGVPQYDVRAVKNMRFPCVVKGALAVFVSNIEVSAWEEPSGTGAPQYGFYIANECTLPAAYDVNDSLIVVDVSNAVIKFGVVTTAN